MQTLASCRLQSVLLAANMLVTNCPLCLLLLWNVKFHSKANQQQQQQHQQQQQQHQQKQQQQKTNKQTDQQHHMHK